jgi:hypothetical protein
VLNDTIFTILDHTHYLPRPPEYLADGSGGLVTPLLVVLLGPYQSIKEQRSKTVQQYLMVNQRNPQKIWMIKLKRS